VKCNPGWRRDLKFHGAFPVDQDKHPLAILFRCFLHDFASKSRANDIDLPMRTIADQMHENERQALHNSMMRALDVSLSAIQSGNSAVKERRGN